MTHIHGNLHGTQQGVPEPPQVPQDPDATEPHEDEDED